MDRSTRRLAALLPIAALLAAACSSSAEPPAASPTASSAPASPSATPTSSSPSASPSPVVSGSLAELGSPRVLADRLEVPWGLAFLADGAALVAERRSGDIVLVRPDGTSATIGRVPGVRDEGEGGLLGLALVPDGSALLAYLSSTQGDNRVVSLPFDGTSLGQPTVVLDGIPHGRIHNGGRLAIGPDGDLWIGTGDGGDSRRAQDRGSLGGKILRIGLDGSVPSDNPFPGSPVWSYGHRNVQGLAFDSSGQLWATEFGQNTYDELNRIRKGGDYGWPVVEGKGGGEKYVDPVVVWRTSEASPSGLAIVDDVAYVGALRGQRLWQVPLRGSRAAQPAAALQDRYGRIRTVAAAPDGSLWITTSNRDGRGDPTASDDRVIRIPLR